MWTLLRGGAPCFADALCPGTQRCCSRCVCCTVMPFRMPHSCPWAEPRLCPATSACGRCFDSKQRALLPRMCCAHCVLSPCQRRVREWGGDVMVLTACCGIRRASRLCRCYGERDQPWRAVCGAGTCATRGPWRRSRCGRGYAWQWPRAVLGWPPNRWQRLCMALHRPAGWHSALGGTPGSWPVSWLACTPGAQLFPVSSGPCVHAQAPRCTTALVRRAACRAAQASAALRGLPLCERKPARPGITCQSCTPDQPPAEVRQVLKFWGSYFCMLAPVCAPDMQLLQAAAGRRMHAQAQQHMLGITHTPKLHINLPAPRN